MKATLEQGGGHIDGEVRLVGDVTIRGVTREMVLHVSAEGRLTDPWVRSGLGLVPMGRSIALTSGSPGTKHSKLAGSSSAVKVPGIPYIDR